MFKNLLLLCSLVFTTKAGFSAVVKDSVPTFNNVNAYEIKDVDLQENSHIKLKDITLSLFVFLSPECPLCQNYTKTLNQLSKQFKGKIKVIGIVPGAAYSVADVNDFAKKYHTDFFIGIDQNQLLTKYLQATVTPQVILIDSIGNLIYKGAIDDWVVALGKKKEKVTMSYAANAITQYLQLMPVKLKSTKAYGCKINDL